MKKFLAVFLSICMTLVVFVPLALPVAADTSTVDTFNAQDASPTISTAADYLAFFNSVFVECNAYEGKVITMTHDITLNDVSAADWYTNVDAVKFSGAEPWSWFKGTFDGGNHTLKGVIVDGTYRSDKSVGIFPVVGFGGCIKNLTVDGFYVCSPNTDTEAAYGQGGTGGLIGHAKANVTIDNVTMKNGTVTCVASGKGAIGAVVGAYDGQVEGQQFKITNTTVEESVKVVPGNDSVYVGGIIGYVHENYLSNPTTIDLSASKIQPYNSTDALVSLKPIGQFRAGGNPVPGFTWTLVNNSTEYSKAITMEGGTDYTNLWNTEVIATGCYGGEYAELDTYTVTWIVDGVQTTEDYPQGAVPSYKGSTDKAMTETKMYVFTGWSPALAPVTTDATYTAQYTEYNKVEIKWVVDGQETVEYYIEGDTPNYKGETNKEQDDDFVYIFKGWDKQVVAAKDNVTYTAVYETKAKYEVIWVIDGVETKETYLAGVKPSFKGKVEKAEDDEYTYEFIGWDKEIVAAEADVTYTAQFEKTAKNPSAGADTEASGGCGGSISVGVAVVAMIGAVGAIAIRKKED